MSVTVPTWTIVLPLAVLCMVGIYFLVNALAERYMLPLMVKSYARKHDLPLEKAQALWDEVRGKRS